jgi:hypothetical protein
MQLEAKQFEEAILTCLRGLDRKPGALSRAWLLTIEAQALTAKGQAAAGRRVLDEALRAAEQIPSKEARENNVRNIEKMRAAQSN